LQQPLLDSQVCKQVQAEAEAIPEGDGKCPQDTPTLGRNWGETNVPTVIRKDTGRMNVPRGPGTPQKPPRVEAEARSSKENISPLVGEPTLGRKHFQSGRPERL
jgi:hypothetical protein